MYQRTPILFPIPKTWRINAGTWSLPLAGTFDMTGSVTLIHAAQLRLQRALGSDWKPVRGETQPASIRFRFTEAVTVRQAYRLQIDESGITAEAHDREGLFYAAGTLAQLLCHYGNSLPYCEIEDVPDFAIRGVMLDVSRDKVPTMETLYWLIDHLAELKYNHLQLYIEHTFAYQNHREVWKDASPLTAEEIQTLDAYCLDRCIDLVPNQNSFGHLERWLEHARYLPLAELPQGGAPLPWGGFQAKPASLCPTDPRSFELLSELYDELLPNFSSRLFNVGCDEPFDLRGPGRSQEQVKQKGEGLVYLDTILKLHQMVTARGKRMAFWGDIIINHPEYVREVPPDALVLEWGYEADHPFDAHGAIFAASKIPFCVCPGTSSWNSLSGRTDNMRANIFSAAENGLKHGACGLIVCDWGDWGHWQPLGLSFPGFTYAACASWNVEATRDMNLATACDAHITEGYGQLLLELGDVYRLAGVTRGNSTELFHILSKLITRPLLAGVSTETLEAVLKRLLVLEHSLSGQSTLLEQEIAHTFLILRAACHRGIALLSGNIHQVATRKSLKAELDTVTASLGHVWKLRNREGGLKDSLARLAPIREEYTSN
ncbi:MAG: family 20 glycosylhydrolase [bacterium]